MPEWPDSFGHIRAHLSYFVLSDLSKGRSKAKTLAREWGSNVQNINRKLKELEELDLIKAGEYDKSGKYYHITEKGEDVLGILKELKRNRERLENVIQE